MRLLLALPACLSLCLFLKVAFTDESIGPSLFPADIQASLLRGLGGAVELRPSGQRVATLSAISVFLRLLTSATVLTGISTLVTVRTRRRDPGHRPNERTADVWTDELNARLNAMALPGGIAAAWLVVWYFSALISPAASVWIVLTVPQMAGLVGGLFLAACLAGTSGSGSRDSVGLPRSTTDTARWRMEPVVVAVATLLWITVSFWMNERLYAGLWIPHGDSAMYEEHLWNVWHGKGFRSYLDQGLFLGEHIQFIHLFLLPLHMLWPSHLLLELAESVALGICTWPLYRIVRRTTGSDVAAMWLCLIWLCYVPMHFLDIAVDFKTLRPICYGLPFLFFAIDHAERGHLRASAVCLVMTLTAKEDYALAIAPLGVALAIQFRLQPEPDRDALHRSRWAAGVAVLTVTYLLTAVLVLIPWFRSGAPVHYSRYFGDLGSSPGDLVRSVIQRPFAVLGKIASLRTVSYAIVFLVPLVFLPVLSPLRLAASLPTFLMLSLLQFSTTGGDAGSAGVAVELPPVPFHHFHAPMLPLLFWAAAGGMRQWFVSAGDPSRREQWWRLKVTPGLAGWCVTLLIAVAGSMTPLGAGFWSSESGWGYAQRYVPGPRALQWNKLLPTLPMTARIASTDYVHTRLTHCERSYDYSDYPRAVNQYQPGVPPDTDLIVIDTRHYYSRIRSVDEVPELRQHPESWRVRPDETDGHFIVLERKRGHSTLIKK